MSLVNYCQCRETRNRSFTLPNRCVDCAIKMDLHSNYNTGDNNDDISNLIFINSDGKNANINEETNIPITNDSSIIYKDALLNSLYSQIDFLKKELSERNMLIKCLLIKESVFYRNQRYHGDLSDSNSDDVSDSTEVDERNDYNIVIDDVITNEIPEHFSEQSDIIEHDDPFYDNNLNTINVENENIKLDCQLT